MRISSAFPSKYLKAADLQGRQVKALMSHVETETIGDDDRPVLYFQGKEKGLILNKTNANSISAVYGDDTEDWRGGEIVLFETMVDFQGKTMAAIRCRVLAPKSDPKAAEIDDEIPF
jgi:arabinogalactan endo-1,4-beta-galactosidase